ncbi:MAG: LysR family transcriptional regulator [Alphaproteobacteria bacterium]|uniref:LysR family transcriptional regulator n=1 Tax=Aestuariivirga sp. TaxID=2650926 RepID=UPI0030163B28|nr:LysR family transcriptional regulator [Alphaproteobacteria bacterium]
MIDRLKSALALAETLNFHRAAQRLDISQPHLTRLIKSLEKDLGMVLFERGPHGVTLTPDGSRALKEAAVLIKAEAAFNVKIEALRNSSAETLRIAVGAYISQSWAASAITAMKTADAGISISLRELDWWTLSDAVHSGDFDLAIGELSEANKNPDLIKEPFPEREGSIIVRAGHQLAGRNEVTLEEIARFPLAGPRVPGRIAQLLPPACAMGTLSADGQFFIPVIECATPRSMIDVVCHSNAICMLWPEYCAEQLRSGQVLELPFHPPWLRATQGIMYRRNKALSPAALAFRNVARNAERKYFRHRQT